MLWLECITFYLSIFFRYMITLGITLFVVFQDVSGQVILITGGGGGVGAHLARNFGHLKSKVIIWDVNTDGRFHLIYNPMMKLTYPVSIRIDRVHL